MCVFIVILMVSGCVAPNYIHPVATDTDYAKVRFVTHETKGKNVFVYNYKTQSCTKEVTKISALGGLAMRHNRQRLGMPLGEDIDDKMLTEVLLDPSKSYMLSMAYWALFKTCNINFNFNPKPNKMYEVSFDFKEKKTCQIQFFEIVKSEDNMFNKIPDATTSIAENSCLPGALK